MSQPQDTVVMCRAEEGCDRPAKTRGLCHKHYHRVWRSENPEQQRENGRRWREENAERLSKTQREWYLANREKVLERQRQQRDADPEAYRKRQREAAARRRKKDPEGHREKNRRWRAKRLYGLSLEEAETILARGCAICGSHDGRIVGKRTDYQPPESRLCLDHDHASGKVRDALCHECNSALGLMKDDPARLRAAADYIEQHQEN